ncbi:hypothetical protein [Paenibacillus albus]|uniref:DUF4064 domain-containing protein n=1 Tax=Paenibacillus albus TaxID=2495582 RepID=A0A3S9A3Z5_9BACL|nr:hypothetical protein [Paenibacillus albus]AZN40446.1 hypothetical protein EJC50_12870 [Paenibacillus albus]
MKTTSMIYKWITGSLNATIGSLFSLIGFLAIYAGMETGSIANGPLVTFSILTALFASVHVVGLVFAIKAGGKKLGHIMGIIASVVWVIPAAGFIINVLAVVFLMMEAAKEGKRKNASPDSKITSAA